MATESAFAASSSVNPTDAPTNAWSRLWQVPVFCTGVLVLAGAILVHNLSTDSGLRQVQRNLAKARQSLEQPAPQTDEAVALAERVLDQAERFPQFAGEAHFLIGSAYVQQITPAAALTAPAARDQLEQAENLGVASEDVNKLLYRLGKACYYCQDDPQRVLHYLLRTVPEAADDAAEGFEMIARVYLRLTPPNVHAALEANQKQLALPTDNEAILAPARLLRGELLLAMHQADDARKVLARIPKDAPGDAYVKARALRAESCQQDGLFKEAARLWEEILDDRSHPPSQPERIAYFLGVCQARDGRRDDAETIWEKASQGEGEAAQAAALRLAELQLPKNAALAWDSYEKALRTLLKPADYQNTLLPLAEARRICELGCRSYVREGDFDRSQRLAQLYAKLAVPGTAQERFAEAAEAWAKLLEDQAKQSSGEMAERDAEAARVQFCRAGAAYEAVAEVTSDVPAQADWLWRSADRFLRGQDYARALTILKRYLDMDLAAERLGEGWFTLARAYLSLHQDVAAHEAFRRCIVYSGPFAYRARYQLALAQIRQGDLDEAEDALKQNLELMRQTTDAEAHEQTIFTLAGLLFQRRQYQMASMRYQEALDHYPASSQGTTARFQLAECFRFLARQESSNLGVGTRSLPDAQTHYQSQYRVYLGKAMVHYQKLADDLTARQTAARLTEMEDTLLRQAMFAIAECRFEQGQYEDAIRLYEVLAVRFHHQLDSLNALAQITRCYLLQREAEKARGTLEQVRTTMKDMDDAAFGDVTDHKVHEAWEDWLKRREQDVKNLQQ